MSDQKNNYYDWINQTIQDKDHELLIKGYQVMQDWEDLYMKRLAEIAVSKGGKILEVGYGMGISAKYIESMGDKFSKHIIIEAHPEVFEKAKRELKTQIEQGKVEVINGYWEEATKNLEDEYFDGILFDTCPLNQETVFFHYFPFFGEGYRLLKKDGIFTYFSDEPTEISEPHIKLLEEAGFDRNKIDFEVVDVEPPDECRYWPYKTIIAPIVYK